MRNINLKFLGLSAVVFLSLTTITFGTPSKEETKSDDKMLCQKTEEMEKTLTDKGYFRLLSMNNSDKVTEALWVGGQTATIIAKVPNSDSSCLLAIMDTVVYNPNTIEDIWETYKKQTKQKDI